MIKRFCDSCGKEVDVYKDLEFRTCWTITRHGMLDLTTELCDACYQEKFTADTSVDWTSERQMKGEPMISPEEFAEKMRQIAVEKYDEEQCHIEMDDYICEVLRALGYEEGVAIFENAHKWYA